jgi:hypothetical protein
MVSFRSEQGSTLVECFYLVEDAATGAEAFRAAYLQARSEGERLTADGSGGWRVRVQQVVRDRLGTFGLSVPMLDEMGIFRPSMCLLGEVG